MFFSYFYAFAISLTCTIMLSGCASQLSREPQDTIEHLSEVCGELNCWAGVTPGTMTFSQAQTLLENRYGSMNIDVSDQSITWETTEGIDASLSGWITADEQGTVRAIDVFFLQGKLTVAQLIERFGEPSIVYVARPISSDDPCPGALISYRELGVNGWLYPEDEFVGVNPTQSIQSLMLLSQSEANGWNITDHIIIQWEGYRDYCELARHP